MKKNEIKKEIREHLQKGDLEKAMFCAGNGGFYGVATKIALKQNDHFHAGYYLKQIGNLKEAFNEYEKVQGSAEELSEIAKKLKDSKLVLRVFEKAKEDSIESRFFWENKYSEFTKKNYGDYGDFKKTKEEIAFKNAEEKRANKKPVSSFIGLYIEAGKKDLAQYFAKSEISNIERKMNFLNEEKNMLEKISEQN